MTTDQDPMLRSLFEIAKQDLSGDEFSADVMAQIDKLRRRTIIGWACVILLLAPAVWLLAAPLQEAVQLLTQVLPRSLIELDDSLLAQVLSPVNSVAGLVALGLLGLRFAYKKIF